MRSFISVSSVAHNSGCYCRWDGAIVSLLIMIDVAVSVHSIFCNSVCDEWR